MKGSRIRGGYQPILFLMVDKVKLESRERVKYDCLLLASVPAPLQPLFLRHVSATYLSGLYVWRFTFWPDTSHSGPTRKEAITDKENITTPVRT